MAEIERPPYCKRLLKTKEPCKCYYCQAKASGVREARRADKMRRPEFYAELAAKRAGARKQKAIMECADWYVVGQLRQAGVSRPTSELIEIKREQLSLRRLAKQMAQAAIEATKEESE